ncbi:MAG: ParB/RepB/Spo0J family partition protein [Prolixibacteraceae bacterium]|nr:ParB/RepB/Spo0J family partition protein [Prolixibacteraceae bacterium]MBT6764200.1 ParB/RepB/Spo0J family partition protein [Prolixibacteraceae bacterium]MBT6999131.1 ParB/RepB/Spo0J family partition protein [Prolixibacteraceae bacterium]MBT7396085.1 ParB/RepB/Spo0J family partition protein [Prolixibacteraceae bacterium]
MAMVKRNALGRGLGALIDDAGKMQQGAGMNEIDLNKIEANPFQPRSKFDEEALDELAASIREIGLIQPITLRNFGDGKYQIIAGERRFRAAQIAGLKTIPAYIRKAKDDDMLEMALIENIQREDLDAIEIAVSYQRLMEECEFTQEDLSTRVGKKRSTIANYLRLLKLPATIQKGLREKLISMGHARAIINIDNQETQILIFNQIIKYGLSVRKVEEIVRDLNAEVVENDTKTKHQKFPKEYQITKTQLDKIFNSNIDFSMNNKGKGKIVIPFKSAKDLERIVKIIENQK